MKIAIIGCGVAGLSAARELRRQGVEVTIYDKSRGVGGRMSTRYAGEWEFDHGAQFFTAQDEGFQAEVDAAIEAGVAAPWPAKGLYLDKGVVSKDRGRKRFVGIPRMNSLPKYWAEGLNVELGRRVISLSKTKNWSLKFEDGAEAGGYGGVISTLPSAQAAALIPKGFAEIAAVKAAQMHVCFCLMVGLPKRVDLGWDTLRVKDLPIDWIALNQNKPQRPRDVGTLVIHSEPKWSDEHVEADRAWVQNVMLSTASALTGLPLADAPHIALHRWLYASNKVSPNRSYIKEGGLILAGDWCQGGRVQGAWLSGRAAARAMMEDI